MVIQKNNVTAQIIEYIKEEIKNGEWKVNEMIPSENTLTARLDVSRASVRAALQHFIALGIMESRHGKGTVLCSNDLVAFEVLDGKNHSFSMMDIVQSLEFRAIVERGTVALAVEKITESELEKLEEQLKAMRERVGNSEEFVQHDLQFHRIIAAASGNKLLEHSLNEVLNTTVEYHRQLNNLVGYQNGIYYHTMILEAMKKQEKKKAAKLMEEHLITSKNDANDRMKHLIT